MVSIEEIKMENPVKKQGNGKSLIDQIPEYEQQRLIQQSGLFGKPTSEKLTEMQKFLISVVSGFIISCFQLLMEQLVHQQFIMDVDQGAIFRKWPSIGLAWGLFVYLTQSKFSDGYLTISHILSALYALSIFSKQYPNYGDSLKVAAVVPLCAYSSYQLNIKPLIFALVVEFILYFVVVK